MSKRNNPTGAPKEEPERLVPLGEIVATHGVQGWLKLKPYNPETEGLSLIQKIVLEKAGVCSERLLQANRAYGGLFLIKLEGIESIEDAKKWVGSTLAVAEEGLRPLEPGEYYYYQVLGLDVYDTHGQWLGVLSRVWSKKGGDLYVVQGTAKEYLIPAVKELIEQIDLPGRKIIVNPPPGLLDL